ncbi:HipA N-terminal domain-containing protein [Algoriphagus antarcticus]|nr:HipA N-terminal domain-containing protein [Algoriphagus antarcticus]
MSKRIANVFMHGILAGQYIQDGEGYHYTYLQEYLDSKEAQPISLTLPLQVESFDSLTMLPFFDGLIPEGWLLDIAVKNWKLDSRDRMVLLLLCCKDTIGAVSIEPLNEPA